MSNFKFQKNLSIIIVYFGDFQALSNLLVSIKKNKIRHSYEVIVVNNKLDEDIERLLKQKFKGIVYIKSSVNIGYGKGNNLGAKHAKGKYLFIVNPDTKVISGSIDSLVYFLEKQRQAAIIAPNLIDTKGKLFDKQGTRVLTPSRAIFSLTILSKIMPNNKFFRDYYMLDLPKNSFREVDVAPGSAFMIKKVIFDKLGGFDKNIFLYFEEMDLCKRIRDKGLKVFMTPDLILEHDWSPTEGDKKLNRIFRQSRFYYFKKYYGVINAFLVEFFARISKESTTLVLVILTLLILGFWL